MTMLPAMVIHIDTLWDADAWRDWNIRSRTYVLGHHGPTWAMLTVNQEELVQREPPGYPMGLA